MFVIQAMWSLFLVLFLHESYGAAELTCPLPPCTVALNAKSPFAHLYELRNALRDNYPGLDSATPKIWAVPVPENIPFGDVTLSTDTRPGNAAATTFTYTTDPANGCVTKVTGNIIAVATIKTGLGDRLFDYLCQIVVTNTPAFNSNKCGEQPSLRSIDKGHIVAQELGGSNNDPINMFPQWIESNRWGRWRQFEMALKSALGFANCVGNITITITFTSCQGSWAYSPSGGTYQARINSLDCWKDLRTASDKSSNNLATLMRFAMDTSNSLNPNQFTGPLWLSEKSPAMPFIMATKWTNDEQDQMVEAQYNENSPRLTAKSSWTWPTAAELKGDTPAPYKVEQVQFTLQFTNLKKRDLLPGKFSSCSSTESIDNDKTMRDLVVECLRNWNDALPNKSKSNVFYVSFKVGKRVMYPLDSLYGLLQTTGVTTIEVVKVQSTCAFTNAVWDLMQYNNANKDTFSSRRLLASSSRLFHVLNNEDECNLNELRITPFAVDSPIQSVQDMAMTAFNLRGDSLPSDVEAWYITAFGEALDPSKLWSDYNFDPAANARIEIKFGKPPQSAKDIFRSTTCSVAREIVHNLGCQGV